MTSERIRWLTRTALFLALLIALQWATSLLGNQFVTGSAVNFVLFITVMLMGLASGLSVAVISPFMAALLPFTPPLSPVTPIIAAGNAALVFVVWLVSGSRGGRPGPPAPLWQMGTAVASAATVKFLLLWGGVSWVAPLFMNVPPPMLVMLSWPQLVTASIGGALAIAALPLLRKAVKPQ
jgi:hypothetical protein